MFSNKTKLHIAVFMVSVSLFSRETEQVSLPAEAQVITAPVVLPKPRVIIFYFDEKSDFNKLSNDLFNIAKDPNIAGILLLIDHNGGRPTILSALHDMVAKIKEQKPVVGLITGVACSGGYWVASATDYLIAHTVSSIGSIGCTYELHRYKNRKVVGASGGIDADLVVELFSKGRYKDLGNVQRKQLSSDERIHIEKELDKLYQLIISSVAHDRKLNIKEADKWADGKEFWAPEALELGLIDEIGTRFDAEKKLLELIRLKNPALAFSDEIDFVFIAEEKNSEGK